MVTACLTYSVQRLGCQGHLVHFTRNSLKDLNDKPGKLEKVNHVNKQSSRQQQMPSFRDGARNIFSSVMPAQHINKYLSYLLLKVCAQRTKY